MTPPRLPARPGPAAGAVSAGGERTPVVACVVRRHDHVLVCRRPDHKRHGGLWEFPGGKVDPGETLLGAARRELAEELAVEVVSIDEPLFRAREDGAPFEIIFLPTRIAGEPRPLEHPEHRWADMVELAELPLAPSDRRFVHFWLKTRQGL